MRAPVAQGIEQRTSNPLVEGSNPSRRAIFCTLKEPVSDLIHKFAGSQTFGLNYFRYHELLTPNEYT